MVFHI